MSNWRHECGYKEPEECAFCMHCEKHKDIVGGDLVGKQGSCVRTEDPHDKIVHNRLQFLREHSVSLRGTCRHFRRKQ